jgi:hypothetical protein
MVTRLVTLKKTSCEYPVLVQDNKLYRREKDSIGEWKFYGGATFGVDFRIVEGHIEGIGRNAGKNLEKIVRIDLRTGDTLIVSPINSALARSGDGKKRQFIISLVLL